jgi:hypothetical protein
VWVVALDIGVIGDYQSAGMTVANMAALTLANLRNPGDLFSCDAPRHRIWERAALRASRGEAGDAGELPCSRSAQLLAQIKQQPGYQ